MGDIFTDNKQKRTVYTYQLDIYNMNYQELCKLRLMIEKEIERRLMSLPY